VAVPDRSTLSKNRHGRFRDGDVLRELFGITESGTGDPLRPWSEPTELARNYRFQPS
jgi:hypothetical protein